MSGKRVLMKLCPDALVHKFASDLRDYHSIPVGRRFVSPSKDVPKADRNWTQLTADSLGAITLNDRLIVLAHGEAGYIDGQSETWYPDELARDLDSWGLKEVGYIKFLCCDLGRANFLDDFVDEAIRIRHIKVGMVQGYRGTSWSILGPRKMLVATADKHWLKFGDKRVKRVHGTFKPNAAHIHRIDRQEELAL